MLDYPLAAVVSDSLHYCDGAIHRYFDDFALKAMSQVRLVKSDGAVIRILSFLPRHHQLRVQQVVSVDVI